MKTYFAKPGEIKPVHYLINAEGQVLGRLAVAVARLLIGKHKPSYTPHVIGGDAVIVINAKGVRLTGAKQKQKTYRHYTTYPGGLREVPFEKLMAERPEEVVLKAVRKMLPKNRLGVKMLTRLHVYGSNAWREQAQKPVEYKLSQ
jgi:large subunit ribosomal protein L13